MTRNLSGQDIVKLLYSNSWSVCCQYCLHNVFFCQWRHKSKEIKVTLSGNAKVMYSYSDVYKLIKKKEKTLLVGIIYWLHHGNSCSSLCWCFSDWREGVSILWNSLEIINQARTFFFFFLLLLTQHYNMNFCSCHVFSLLCPYWRFLNLDEKQWNHFKKKGWETIKFYYWLLFL